MRIVPVLLIVSFLLAGCASGIEGTWVLVSRDLPDGRVQRPPVVMGCLSYADGRRNFNVYWEDAGGPVSISSIAEYELTDTEYRETNLYYRTSGFGEGVQYDLSNETGVAPVRRVNGRIEFDLPLHEEPSAVFDGDRFRATRPGAFVDHWRRVD